MILVKETDTGIDIHMEGSASELIIQLVLLKKNLYLQLKNIPKEEIDSRIQLTERHIDEFYKVTGGEKETKLEDLAKDIIEGL